MWTKMEGKPKVRERWSHTYSIVALDPATGQLGVAVQSHAFGVGGRVGWAESGVGAVATQSLTDVSYGPLGLALMRAGKTAAEALAGLLASDPRSDVRQVAMIDRLGNVAAHTGRGCIPAAGDRQGKGYSVQANLMLRDAVWPAMAAAFESAGGELADRMLASLEAAQAEGGDIRGQQSAHLLVVGGAPTGRPWSDTVYDLRVDDHPEPLIELRRLHGVARADQLADRSVELLRKVPLDDTLLAEARAGLGQALASIGDAAHNPELVFWFAVGLAAAGRLDDARPYFQTVFRLDPIWREVVPRLTAPSLLPDDAALIRRICEID